MAECITGFRIQDDTGYWVIHVDERGHCLDLPLNKDRIYHFVRQGVVTLGIKAIPYYRKFSTNYFIS